MEQVCRHVQVPLEHVCCMAAGQSPLSCWTAAAGAQELLWPGPFGPGSKKLQPWPGKSSKWADSSHSARGQHTAAPSFPAREDESERGEGGGGQLDWTGLKGQFSLHENGGRAGHPTRLAAVFGLSDAEALARAAFLGRGGGEGWVRAPLRATNAAEAFVCFPQRMSVKGSLIFIHILRVVLISSTFSIWTDRTYFTSSCDLAAEAGQRTNSRYEKSFGR